MRAWHKHNVSNNIVGINYFFLENANYLKLNLLSQKKLILVRGAQRNK